jgi:two-component system nitrate/nitrite sensor histidine kinase NarX
MVAGQQTSHWISLRVWRMLRSARLLMPLLVLLLGLFALLLMWLLWSSNNLSQEAARYALLACGLMMGGAVFLLILRLRKQLLEPLARLESSVAQVCQGEPEAKLLDDKNGVLSSMVADIHSLNEELTDLYEDMDTRVARHTTRLAQKTASLKILYDVAASINQADNLDELLLRFLRVLKEMVNGLAATVRLVRPDGNMRLVGSIGLDNDMLTEHQLLPLDLCACGAALSPGDILCDRKTKHCSKRLGRDMFAGDEVDLISVTLDYHDEVLGLYHIYVRKPGISGREDIIEMLQTIGNHLGMAVAKHHSDQEARRLYIVEERTSLAHELHDSLAQTLASLRFQVRLLQDVLKSGDEKAASSDLLRIRNGLDEAHTELRELLHSFRAPVDQQGLANALRKSVERFSQESGVQGFYQQDCPDPALSSSDEMQILRIAQESLTNIRKHAQAHTVRVFLRCQGNRLRLLIEDDGVGFEHASKIGQPGEHVGLSIMQERAQRLGGTLRIESEKGEGTQVELTYKLKVHLPAEERNWLV